MMINAVRDPLAAIIPLLLRMVINFPGSLVFFIFDKMQKKVLTFFHTKSDVWQSFIITIFEISLCLIFWLVVVPFFLWFLGRITRSFPDGLKTRKFVVRFWFAINLLILISNLFYVEPSITAFKDVLNLFVNFPGPILVMTVYFVLSGARPDVYFKIVNVAQQQNLSFVLLMGMINASLGYLFWFKFLGRKKRPSLEASRNGSGS